MRAISYIFCAGLCLTGASASAIVVAPTCEAADGTVFYRIEALQGGWVTAYGDGIASEVTILASCSQGKQLRIDYSGGGVSPHHFFQELADFVASSETYTLEELAVHYGQVSDVKTSITTIPAELCNCLNEGQ